MAPATGETPSDETESTFQRHPWLLPLLSTPVILLPAVGRPVEPYLAVLACAVGGVSGVALVAAFDRYGRVKSRLQGWNDVLVLAVFLVPLLLGFYVMRLQFGRNVIVYQSIGMLGLMWGGTLQGVVSSHLFPRATE